MPDSRSRFVGPASKPRTRPGIAGADRLTETGSPPRRNQTSPRTAAAASEAPIADRASARENAVARRLTRREFTPRSRTPPALGRHAHDHDRARGSVGDLRRRRAEQRGGEVAATLVADHEQVRLSSCLEQRRDRRAFDNLHDGLVLLAEHLARLLGGRPLGCGAARVEHLHVVGPGHRHESGVGRSRDRDEAPGVDDDEGRRAERSLLRRPLESGGRMLGSVDPDDDRPRHAPILPGSAMPPQAGSPPGRLSFERTVKLPSKIPASEADASEQTGEHLDPLVESYRKLADVFHEVLSEQSLDDLLERIAGTVGELIPYDDITFYEADEAKRELRAVYASGPDAAKVLADDAFSFGVGITGWAADHREPVLANRAELDPRVRFVANTTPDPESLIAVPLVARGHLKGTLNIYRSGYQEFTEDEFRLVVRFADAAALAIDNAHIRASLERQAQTDPLTGLWNHRAFHEQLRQELLVASTEQTPVALVMLDLDDFKRVNDVYSHATGDHVLSEVASILLATVRAGDTVCRIGGEEFAIIVPASGLSEAFRLAERIQEQVAAAPLGPVGPVSLSVGIASGPTHAANPRELVACAEVAMMTAKTRGKGKIVVFQEDSLERPGDGSADRGAEFRSIAHLKMLHGVSTKLSRLNDVAAIGATIAAELRLLIDYHNCRVFVREGDDLRPIAFRGDLSASGSAMDLLATRVRSEE